MKHNGFGKVVLGLVIAALAMLLSSCTMIGNQSDVTHPIIAPSVTPYVPEERVVTTIPRNFAQQTSTVKAQTPSPTAPALTATPQLPAAALMDVKMIDQTTGWALDEQGHILRTEQGAGAWQNVTPPLVLPTPAPDSPNPNAPIISAVYFLDGKTAFAIQRPDALPPLDWKLITWRTSDGGQTWTSTAREPFSMPESEGTPIQLDFLDARHGWLYMQIWPGMMHCETVILETKDAGETWQKVESSFAPNGNGAEAALSGAYSLPYGHNVLNMLDERVGFASNGDLMATTDGGHDWRVQVLPHAKDFPTLQEPYEYRSPAWFSSAQDGVLLDRVYESNDAPLPPGDVFMAPPRAAYLYFTHNGGETWTPQPAPALMGMPYFINAQTGWFLGQNDLNVQTQPSLWSTQDGGKSWALVAQSTPLLVGVQMQFVDAQYGIAFNAYHTAGRDLHPAEGVSLRNVDVLFETKDGGKTWTQVR